MFTGNDYSHYHSSTAFRFINKATGEEKSWFMNDNEPDSSGKIFERI